MGGAPRPFSLFTAASSSAAAPPPSLLQLQPRPSTVAALMRNKATVRRFLAVPSITASDGGTFGAQRPGCSLKSCKKKAKQTQNSKDGTLCQAAKHSIPTTATTTTQHESMKLSLLCSLRNTSLLHNVVPGLVSQKKTRKNIPLPYVM